MKKAVVLMMVVLLSVGVAMAGDGKSCDAKHASKTVSLTGTLSTAGEHKVFRVSNAEGTQYTVCAESKADLSSIAEGASVKVKGKVVKCSDSDREELVIERISTI